MAAVLAVVGLTVVIVGAFVLKQATNAPAELGATTAPTQATAPTHAPTASRKTASDRFWDKFGIDGDMPSPTSLEGVLTSADAVVLGMVVDVRPGLVVGDEDYPDDPLESGYNANLVVEAQDRLSGPVKAGDLLVVEIFLGTGHPFTPDLAEGIPEDSSVFVLRDKATFMEQMGNPEEVVEAARGLYWFMPGAVFRDIGGIVHVVRGTTRPHITEQDGRPFDEFVAVVRALLGS